MKIVLIERLCFRSRDHTAAQITCLNSLQVHIVYDIAVPAPTQHGTLRWRQSTAQLMSPLFSRITVPGINHATTGCRCSLAATEQR